jgi:hypothetical protein
VGPGPLSTDGASRRPGPGPQAPVAATARCHCA